MTGIEDDLRHHYARKAALARPVDLEFTDLVDSGTPIVPANANGPGRSHWPRTLVAAVATLVAVGVLVAVVTRNRHSGPLAPGREATPSTMPLLAPSWLPEGYRIHSLNDGIDPTPPPGYTAVYRDPAQPLGTRALVVYVNTNPSLSVSEPVTVGGRVTIEESADLGVTAVSFNPVGDIVVRIFARGFTLDEVRAIAATTVARSTDPTDGVDLGDLPDGIVLIDEQMTTPATRNYDLVTTPTGANDPFIAIGAWTTGHQSLEAHIVLNPGTVTPITIRNRAGYAITDTPNGINAIVWTETPGVLVQVKGQDIPVAVLQRVADGLHPATTSEWAALRAATGN